LDKKIMELPHIEYIDPETPEIQGMDIRYTELSDGKNLKEWLKEPGILRWFPMYDEVEIDDAVSRWIGFARYKCSLTATMNGEPCGLVTLYLQPYRKLAHQCEFGIIVGPQYRGKGIGGHLIKNAMNLARNYFRIELLHLQVYAENPAVNLYSRWGFKEFGRQTHWIKEAPNDYRARVFMERFL
jgi:RimJ/RimL family protein N-acetyltransferase